MVERENKYKTWGLSFEEARDETKIDSLTFSMVSDGSNSRVMVLLISLVWLAGKRGTKLVVRLVILRLVRVLTRICNPQRSLRTRCRLLSFWML